MQLRIAELEQTLARVRRQRDRTRDQRDRAQQRRRHLREQLDRVLDGNAAIPGDAASTSAVAGVPGKDRLTLRRECVFASALSTARILEIGPAHNAVFPKREGFASHTVDYLDRDGLVERYRDFSQYSPDDIEEVDHVLAPGTSMSEVIADRYDVVMASHVIEHTTSMVHFLNECAGLLAPGGVVALVVPDHRYCFDRFRERASLGRVIDAWVSPPAVHTMGTVIEERLNATRHGGTTAWAPGHRGQYSPVHAPDSVRAHGEAARKADHYIDTHNWICTPHHLRLLLQDLHSLGFIQLRETYFHDTVRHEFFLNLSLDGPGSGLSREELLVLSDDERRSLDRIRFVD